MSKKDPRRGHRLGLSFTMALAMAWAFASTGCKEKSAPRETEATSTPTSRAPETPATPKASQESARTEAPSTPGPGPARPKAAPAKAEERLSAADYQAATEAAEKIGMPSPPDLTKMPADLGRHVRDTIMAAVDQRTARNLGQVARLYHALTTTREGSERTIQAYEVVRSIDPQSFKWPYYLGRLFLARNSLERSRMEFLKSLNLSPDYARNHVWVGDLELRRQAYEEARAHFQQYVDMAPEDPYGYVGLGVAYLELNNEEKALELFNKALKVNPDSGQAHLALSRYHQSRGDEDLAQRERSIAAGLPRTNGVLRWDPLDLELWLTLGPTRAAIEKVNTFAVAGDWQSAELLGSRLLEQHPDSVILAAGLADFYLQHGRAEKALEIGRRALSIDPDHAPALVVVSDCNFRLQRLEEALQLAEKAIAMDPDLPTGYVARGQVLRALDRPEEALASYRQADELLPNNPYFLKGIADVLYSQDKLAEAREHYDAVLSAAESLDSIPTQLIPAYLAAAEIAVRQDERPAAVEYYRRALRANPTMYQVFRALGQLLLDMDKGEEALAICRTLISQYPQLSEYPLMLGDLMARAGKPQEAIDHFRTLLSKDQGNVGARFLLGRVLHEQGASAEAKKQLQRVIATRPNHEQAYLYLSNIQMETDEIDAAIETVRRGLNELPDSFLLANSLAWMLATRPGATREDGEEAVKWAEMACEATRREVAEFLDTLACAYAAAGQFEKAVSTEEAAIEKLTNDPEGQRLAEFKARLEQFKNGKPYFMD